MMVVFDLPVYRLYLTAKNPPGKKSGQQDQEEDQPVYIFGMGAGF